MNHGIRKSTFAVGIVAALASTVSNSRAAAFDDIEFWIGSGQNRAALVVDWNDGKSAESILWGFRWDGSATGMTMLKAVVHADARLFAHVSTPGAFGVSLYGAGYDLDNDGTFNTSAALSFDSGGLAESDDTYDASTPSDAEDHWREGWLSDGFWSYWLGGTGSSPVWESSGSGMSDRILTDGSWDGLSYAPGYSGAAPSEPVAAAVPEPSVMGMLAAGTALLLARRRRRQATLLATVAATGLILTGIGGATTQAAYTYDPNDFAVEVVSSTGPFGPSPYNDPAAVLGRPTLKFNNSFNPSTPEYLRTKLIQSAFNTGPSGEKLITTLGTASQITVRMGRPVEDDPTNPFGIDFIIFGNSFFSTSGGDFTDDSTNLNAAAVSGSLFAENTKVSVSPDGVNWYTYDNGPYADGLFPTTGYVWDSAAAAWTDTEANPTLPIDPARASEIAGQTAGWILDNIYAGSAGGTGFDLAESGFAWIEFVRVQGLAGFIGGEIDAIADVRSVPEPAALTVLCVVAVTLLGGRRR